VTRQDALNTKYEYTNTDGRELAVKALAIATVLVLLGAAVVAYLFHLYTGVR